MDADEHRWEAPGGVDLCSSVFICRSSAVSLPGRLEPQINTGRMEPQINTGRMEPQMNTDEHRCEPAGGVDLCSSVFICRSSAVSLSGRLEPQINTGRMEPQINTGRMEPQINTGRMEPQMNTDEHRWEAPGGVDLCSSVFICRSSAVSLPGRLEPQINTGRMEPQMDAGRMEPQMNTDEHRCEPAGGVDLCSSVFICGSPAVSICGFIDPWYRPGRARSPPAGCRDGRPAAPGRSRTGPRRGSPAGRAGSESCRLHVARTRRRPRARPGG